MSVYQKANVLADQVTELNVLALDGVVTVVGTPSVTVLETNSDGNVRHAIGATVPTNGDAGYAHGCLFVNSAGGSGTTWYINEGSSTSATFTAVDTAGGFSVPIAAADAASTTTSVFKVTGSALTTGSVIEAVGSGATMTTGNWFLATMGVATAGNAFEALTTGVYTGTGLLLLTANSATTGTLAAISGSGLTTGVGLKITAAAATLTTGFYVALNDGALNVLTVGSNGHLTSNQTTAPTIATNATGLSAVAVTAGSTDTCGTITSTGTPASGTVITLTFNKTYTVAPKVCVYTPANAAAGGVNTMPIVTTTATTAVFTWPAGGVYAATPSWTYLVIA